MNLRKASVALPVLFCVVLAGFDYLQVQKAVDETKSTQRSSYEQHTKTFKAEESALTGWDFLPNHTCNNDAGPVLNPMLAWDGDISQSAWAKTTALSPKTLPIDRALLRDAKKSGWAKVLTVASTENVDFGWWDEIPQKYDCWDIDNSSPRMELILLNTAMETPIPMAIDISNWGLLRLAEGRKTGNDQAALQSYRGWVKLLMSSENLVNVMVAVAMLKNEARHLEHLESIGVSLPDWKGIDHETVSTLRRVGMASAAYGGLHTPESHLHVSSDLFPCLALSEALTIGSLFSTEARELFPKHLEHINQQLSSSPCRLKSLRAKWKQKNDGPLFEDVSTVCNLNPGLSCVISRQTGWVPAWSQAMFVNYALSSVNFAFSAYNKK